jgi:hypothetical protein
LNELIKHTEDAIEKFIEDGMDALYQEEKNEKKLDKVK